MQTNLTRGLLEARNLTVLAGEKVLIQNVDLTVSPGKLTAIIGPNGAGKSTLIKALTGERPIHSGTITLDGAELGEIDSVELAQRRACLPQSSSLSFPFTIREVVSIGRHPYRESEQKTQESVENALSKVSLLPRIDEGYLHLSGGEKQRVHLARALAQLQEPLGRVLLLDEPTASLDLTFQHLVFEIATNWARDGASVLIVLHDISQAMHYADEVIVLDKGKVYDKGSPKTMLTPELIKEVYQVQAKWVQTEGHCLLAVDDSFTQTNREQNT